MTSRGRCSFRVGTWLTLLIGLGWPAVPAWSQQIQISTNLAVQLRYIQLRVVSGRVTAGTKYPGRSISSNSSNADRQERLSVRTGGTPEVNYELTTSQWRIALDLTQGNQLQIRREPKDAADVVLLDFSQPANGILSLKLGAGPDARIYRAASLWHLLLAEPEVCQKELVPLMQLLRPGWPLIATAGEVEEAMYRAVGAMRKYDRGALNALVEELGSDRFARRRTADRQLRDFGQAVLPYLRSLDHQTLDAEQGYRVRNIIESLAGTAEEDTPQSIAGWMAADPAAWYTLLPGADESKQQIAVEQISQLLNEPVEFDPRADAQVRRAQLDRIGQQVQRQAVQGEEVQAREEP